jgi:hypothetical protein
MALYSIASFALTGLVNNRVHSFQNGIIFTSI